MIFPTEIQKVPCLCKVIQPPFDNAEFEFSLRDLNGKVYPAIWRLISTEDIERLADEFQLYLTADRFGVHV